jgi:L-aminopeptidase/D-esterase-like protein
VTLTTVPGIRVGHASTPDGSSGCTVVLGPFRGAVEIRGMATGSRELEVLSPEHLVEGVDAIVLAGGSAFGLATAQGVVEWLEEQGAGFDTGVAKVPLVPGAVIFDLTPGGDRPGPVEGRLACEAASSAPVEEGRVGAGAGATVGKVLGPRGSVPGGIGSASGVWRGHRVGALAVVNALGDVLGPAGEIIAGPRDEEGMFIRTDSFLRSREWPGEFGEAASDGGSSGRGGPAPGTNTTLVVVGTEVPLSRVDLRRLARVASGALPRAISPAGTPFDGDLLFALSAGEDPVTLSPGELLALAVAAREVVEEAIRRGVGWSRGSGD